MRNYSSHLLYPFIGNPWVWVSKTQVVVSKIFVVYPYLGKMNQFDYYFSTRLKPPTSFVGLWVIEEVIWLVEISD